ncbi:MAG: hypothetical protein EBU49_07160, partial [Proteobacteria bacterium]|nr:hypothetical protein [Pseudomonadota bacterium]
MFCALAQRSPKASHFQSIPSRHHLKPTRSEWFGRPTNGEKASEKVWSLAVAQPSRLVDLVESLPLVGDPAVRSSLYSRIVPLLKGLPDDAAHSAPNAAATAGRFVRV